MKKRNVEEDVVENKIFVMEEYTEFLKQKIEKHKDITKIVFKITSRIYKAIKNGANEEQIKIYIDILKKNKNK